MKQRVFNSKHEITSIAAMIKSILFTILGLTFFSFQPTNRQLLFLTLKIEKASISGEENIYLINKTIVDGHLKENTNDKVIDAKSKLRLSFLGNDKKLIGQIEIENPLLQNVEYVDLEGALQTKLVERSHAEFNIRINYQPDIKSLNISRIDDGKSLSIISSINLDL